MKTEYYVVRCSNLSCGKFSYCKAIQKTKMCPYCERRINLSKIEKIAVETNSQARKLVQEFNKKLGELREPSWYKENKGKQTQ